MSFNENLQKSIEKNINNFIKQVAQTYSLEEEDLQKLWSGKNKTSPTKKTIGGVIDIDTGDLSHARLIKCTVAELKALCREHGHKVSGKKDLLIKRLLGTTDEIKIDVPKKSKVKGNVNQETPTVVKNLTKDISATVIRKNDFGNYAHPETSLVFDKDNNRVIGKQEDDGTISELTDDDIQRCKQFKFDYKIPTNLDHNNDDVKIEGVDDSEDEVDSESDVELIEEEVDIDEDGDDSDVMVETDDEE